MVGVPVAVAALCLALTGASRAPGHKQVRPVGRQVAAKTSWGIAGGITDARFVPPPNSAPEEVSCAESDNCSIGGAGPDGQAFVASEINGRWGGIEAVRGLSPPGNANDPAVNVISCGAPGDCAAAGSTGIGDTPYDPFLVTQVNGTWGSAEPVPGLKMLDAAGQAAVESISCASAGNCAAGGWYTDSQNIQAFVVTEVNGRWGSAMQIPGTAGTAASGRAQLFSLSCSSPGNCTGGGWAQNSAFVVSEVNGVWHKANDLAAGDIVWSVSCSSPGACAGAGYGIASGQPFVVSEVRGIWGEIEPVPGTTSLGSGGNAMSISVSCSAPGDCAVAGNQGSREAFVASQNDGKWHAAKTIPGPAGDEAVIDALSCGSAGHCVAGGDYEVNNAVSAALVVTEINGTWNDPEPVRGSAAAGGQVFALSCSREGDCVAVGDAGTGFVADGDVGACSGSAPAPAGRARPAAAALQCFPVGIYSQFKTSDKVQQALGYRWPLIANVAGLSCIKYGKKKANGSRPCVAGTCTNASSFTRPTGSDLVVEEDLSAYDQRHASNLPVAWLSYWTVAAPPKNANPSHDGRLAGIAAADDIRRAWIVQRTNPVLPEYAVLDSKAFPARKAATGMPSAAQAGSSSPMAGHGESATWKRRTCGSRQLQPSTLTRPNTPARTCRASACRSFSRSIRFRGKSRSPHRASSGMRPSMRTALHPRPVSCESVPGACHIAPCSSKIARSAHASNVRDGLHQPGGMWAAGGMVVVIGTSQGRVETRTAGRYRDPSR